MTWSEFLLSTAAGAAIGPLWLRFRRRHFGTRFTILCPFHQERTASCHVDVKGGWYHCFGCGRHGNASELPPDWKAAARQVSRP